MTDAILIFTFSPIQSFITEARRAADLYAGSKILSRLANAAASELQGDNRNLIYPANPNPEDTPNKLVAVVPFEQAEQIANHASKAMLDEWRDSSDAAQKELSQYGPAPDKLWKEIWERQRDSYWDIYWVAQKMNGDYPATFKQASSALDAVKRTRVFKPTEEAGMKDTLSGRRSALCVKDIVDLPAKDKTPAKICREYWRRVQKELDNPSLLRPEGKERLDTLGAVKRFCEQGRETFLSVSSIATADFLDKAQQDATAELRAHRDAVKGWAYRVRGDDDWPYDGDLFFADTLTQERVKDSYGIPVSEASLELARRTLAELVKKVGVKPSPYYAILQLDGDSMGEVISECDEEQHKNFSGALAAFAERVRGSVDTHYGTLIYNGGDDVLALAPLSQATLLARELARVFHENVAHPKHPEGKDQNCTISAGIAIAHHLYPLDAALGAARSAEHRAKEVTRKNAVCVRVRKRSGEMIDVRSGWDAMGETFDEIVKLFQDIETGTSALSSRLAYDVTRSAYALPDADARFESELKRSLKRHRNSKMEFALDIDAWAKQLNEWAQKLPEQTNDLGRWLVFARFVAQGGGE